MEKSSKSPGPLVVADGLADANVSDVVRVGPQRLIGEILNMTEDRADIQVYEETTGLGPARSWRPLAPRCPLSSDPVCWRAFTTASSAP